MCCTASQREKYFRCRAQTPAIRRHERYIKPPVYLIAADGRMLKRSSNGDVSLLDPNLVQGGSARVCSRFIIFAKF